MFEHTDNDSIIRDSYNAPVTDLRYDRSAIFGGEPNELHYRGYRTGADRSRAAHCLAKRGARVVCFQDTQAAFALQVWPNSLNPGICR